MNLKPFILASLLVAPFVSSAQELTDSEFKEALSKLSESEKTEILLDASTPVNLYNFKTGKSESIHRVDLLSASEFEEYLPPLDEVRSMYQLYLGQGLKPYRAYVEAMTQLMIVISQ